jgi:hypothetical protein
MLGDWLYAGVKMGFPSFESLEQRSLLSGYAYVAASSTQLVFNQQAGLSSPTQYLTLTNTGRRTLAISSIKLAGVGARRFALDLRHFPTTLAPGAAAAVKISFRPLDTSISSATLQVTSNARGTPVLSTTLRGLGTAGLFDKFEPSLQRILDTEQIAVNVGDANPNTPLFDGPGRSDEVPLQLMRAAGPSPVRISMMAVFSYDTSPTVTVGWYDSASGSPTLHPMLTSPRGNSQTFSPYVTGSTRFYPTGNFGLYGLWPDQAHGPSMSQDALNTWDLITYQGHKLRFYPYKLPNGRVVANAYVVGMEESNNSDFNDAIAVITNVTFASSSATPASKAMPAVARQTATPFASKAISADHIWDSENP